MKPRIAFLGLLLASVVGALPAYAQTVSGTPADEQAIRELLMAHASSAQQGDVDGMVATQHEDVDERLSNGHLLVGRDEVAQFFESIVSGGAHRLAHTHPAESVRIRFLKPDVAFVDVDSASMSGSGPRTPYFLVVTKVDGEWGVAVVRSGVPIE